MTNSNDDGSEAQVPHHEGVLDVSSEPRIHRFSAVGCDELRHQQRTPVQQFFNGRCVFVTGATGFVGKVLLEKLLRSCPDIGTVYALVRPKKGRGVQERLQDLLSKPVFCKLGKEQRNRLVVLAGDASQPGLGLSPSDTALVRQTVSVIFHVAATIRFDEELSKAAGVNVRGTWELLRLAREMPNLKALVHTSTAYSQCVRRDVRERVFEAPMTAAQLLQVCDGLTQNPGDLKRILGSYPNTYTFTKAVAEHLIQKEFSDLPVVIFRPSMVVANKEEPFPGWVDSANGAMGAAVPACCGLLRVFHCDVRKRMDMVPCDMVVNCMVAAACDVATNSEVRAECPRVYNFISSNDLPLTYSDYIALLGRHTAEWPPSAAVWCYTLCGIRHRILYLLCRLLLHLLPALLTDWGAILAGSKPRLRNIYRRVHDFNHVVAFFTTHDWDFETAQTKALWSRLSPQDQLLLPFDTRAIDWDSYFQDYVCGVRRFLLKEELDTLPAAKLRYRRLLWLHRSIQMAALLVVLTTLCAIIYALVLCFM